MAHPVDAFRKRELLTHLVKTGDWRQVLVFVRTKHGANRLAHQLDRAGVKADAIHGNKTQDARIRALTRFKDNELHVLVATDMAARELDIENLPHVVNYDLPHVPEDYIHRIGRTGRLGSEAEAISLVCAEDQLLLAAIEGLTQRSIEQRVVAGFEPGAVPPPVHNAPPQQHVPRPPHQEGAQPGRRNRRGRRGRGGQQPTPAGQPRPQQGRPPMHAPQHAQRRPQQPSHPRPPSDPQRAPQHRDPRLGVPRSNDLRVYADRDEREAQIREARMRIAADNGDED